MAAYFAIWYGATLAIWVVQRGEVTQVIDLHPHIRAEFDDKLVPLTDHDTLEPLREREEDNDGDVLMPGVALSLLWDDIEVKLPPLIEPLLTAETRTHVERGNVGGRMETYLQGIVDYGSFDVESGETLDPPGAVD
jgi:hypothetical protein